jgi:hypothetical protein
MSCCIWQGSMRFYAAGWSGSMRFESVQYGYWYGIGILAKKKLNMTQKVFSPYRSHGILRNWHGLRCGSMRVKLGRCGFDTVWTWLEIRLCVTVAIAFYLSILINSIYISFQSFYNPRWAPPTKLIFDGFGCILIILTFLSHMIASSISFSSM